MKTVALIPIKLHSSRLPNKNIKPFFDGTPLMTFIQKTCLASSMIDEVYVYCSDESVRPYVIEGVRFLERPEYLDYDTCRANDIIREFMRKVDADIYINAHATSPFAKPETINACIAKVSSGEYDSAFCASLQQVFLWLDGKPINFDPDICPRTQDLPLILAENSIAYVTIRDGLSFSAFATTADIPPAISTNGTEIHSSGCGFHSSSTKLTRHSNFARQLRIKAT